MEHPATTGRPAPGVVRPTPPGDGDGAGTVATAAGWDWRPLGACATGPTQVSVVVLHHDQEPQLARCLEGLRAASGEVDALQVVVTDDGSPRPPRSPLADVVVAAPPDPTFRAAAARNAGVAASRHPLLVLLDADVVLAPGALGALARAAAACDHVLVAGTRRHATLDGLSHAQLLALGDDWEAGLRAHGRRLADPAWVDHLAARTRDLTVPDPHAYRALLSAALALPRALWDHLGGFDEGFVGYGGEDWELAARAVADGALLARPEGAVAWHDGPDAGARGWGPGDARRQHDRLAPLVPDPALRGARTGWDVAAVDLVHHVDDVDEDVLAALTAASDALVGHDAAISVVGPGARRAAAELAGRVRAGDPDDRPRRGWLRLAVPDLLALPGEVLARVAALVDEDELGRCTLTRPGAAPVVADRGHARQRLRRLGHDPAGGAAADALLAEVFPTAALPLTAVLPAPRPGVAPTARDRSPQRAPVGARAAGAADERPVFVLGVGRHDGAARVARLLSSAPGVEVAQAVPGGDGVLARLHRLGGGTDLHAGQRALLRTLLRPEPAAAARWGCAATCLDADGASWLRTLFPHATVVAVVGDPWVTWTAHLATLAERLPAPGAAAGSAQGFGRTWARTVGSFLDDADRVLVRVEDLHEPATLDLLDTCLGAPVDRDLCDAAGPVARAAPVPLTARARELLTVEVGVVAARLGYAAPALGAGVGADTAT